MISATITQPHHPIPPPALLRTQALLLAQERVKTRSPSLPRHLAGHGLQVDRAELRRDRRQERLRNGVRTGYEAKGAIAVDVGSLRK